MTPETVTLERLPSGLVHLTVYDVAGAPWRCGIIGTATALEKALRYEGILPVDFTLVPTCTHRVGGTDG
jgi:hypothetical protein